MPIASAQDLNLLKPTVDQVVAAWPTDCPLVMLHSSALHKQWGRWSILAVPEAFHTLPAGQSEPSRWLTGILPQPNIDPHDETTGPAPLPFAGGWIGYLSYELGQVLEPAARHGASAVNDSGWPLIELAHCPSALVHDHLHHRWHAVGAPAGAKALVDQLDFSQPLDQTWQSGEIISDRPADAHVAAVGRTLGYIAAGDVFQANITQQFRTTFSGCSRALARRALAVSGARYGAYLELPADRCVICMSPELFLRYDARSQVVTTRPIKGTRPQCSDPAELAGSDKDAAELHMITDLMRNDLGRVCEYGSIHVTEPRAIETHPTVHHGVSTIVGRLRPSVALPQLLAATFPAGSVTGAPKIRAMQIINELEVQPRGPYCGAIGMISACGNVSLNVAIRTMLLDGKRDDGAWNRLAGTITYGAGGGIVADSDPLSEYRESLDKTAILRLALKESESAPLATSGESAASPHAGWRI